MTFPDHDIDPPAIARPSWRRAVLHGLLLAAPFGVLAVAAWVALP